MIILSIPSRSSRFLHRKGGSTATLLPLGAALVLVLAAALALVGRWGGALAESAESMGPVTTEEQGQAVEPPEAPPVWVAHAGGGYRGQIYWNHREALEGSYRRGFRYIELDFHWSGDDRLVAIHDWGRTFEKHYGEYNPPWYRRWLAALTGKRLRPPLDAFIAMGEARGFTPLTLGRLADWLRGHPMAHIVTDVKKDNLRALERIRRLYPEILPQIVPQAYQLEELEPIRTLGYARVILTLYRIKAGAAEIVPFVLKERPWAVAMPRKRAFAGRMLAELKREGVFVYVHTINDAAVAQKLAAGGASGFYTDFLEAF